MNSITDFLFQPPTGPVNYNPEIQPLQEVDLKTKSVMVIDHGIFTYVAEKLVNIYGKVYYFCHHQEEYPTIEQLAIGTGIPGVTKVHDPLEVDCDLYVFPNTYDSTLQKQLLKMGKNVWGSRKGDELELNRWYGLQTLSKVGLPVPNATKIIGVDNLINYLRQTNNKYIKISYLRGVTETFHYTNMKECGNYLNVELREACQPLEKYIEFIVFEPIDAKIESGFDCINIDGQFSDYVQLGYEVKDCAYVFKTVKYNELPELIKITGDKLSDVFKGYGYRGFFSNEVRITENKIPYLIDFTCRLGSPSGEPMIENLENIGEVLWYGSQGHLLPLKFKNVYGCQAHIYSTYGTDKAQPIFYPEEIKDYVKLRNYCIVDGQRYIIPEPMCYSEKGTVIGYGSTLQEAIDQCKEHASQISGWGVEIKLDDIEKGLDSIKIGEQYGIIF